MLYGVKPGKARVGVAYEDMNYYEIMEVTVGDTTPQYVDRGLSGGGGGSSGGGVFVDEKKVNMNVAGTPNTWYYNPRTNYRW